MSWQSVWEGDCSLILWLKSQSFSKPVSWDCDLHKCFSRRIACSPFPQLPFLATAFPVYSLKAITPVEHVLLFFLLGEAEGSKGLRWKEFPFLSFDKTLGNSFLLNSRLFSWMFWVYFIMITVTGWILFSLKRYIEFLTSNIYKYGLIWKKGLCRFTQVKIESLGWVLVYYDWYPHTERIPCDDRGRDWSNTVPSQGITRI